MRRKVVNELHANNPSCWRDNMSMNRTRIMMAGAFALIFASVTARDAQAQGTTITGRVMSEQGKELVSANVVIPDLTISVGTNNAGRYTINVPAGRAAGQNVVVRARAIGFVPAVKTVTLTGGAQTVDFSLREDVNRLRKSSSPELPAPRTDQNCVLRKHALTLPTWPKCRAAIRSMRSPEKCRVRTSLSASGRPGSTPAVMFRAPTSISTNGTGASPVYVIDGVALSDQLTNTGGGGLASINTNDIETIEVVKGAAASSVYGARAARGVITITTKSAKDMSEGLRFGSRTEYGTSDIERKFKIAQTHALRLNEDGTTFCISVPALRRTPASVDQLSGRSRCVSTIILVSTRFRRRHSRSIPARRLSKTTAGDPLRNMFQNEKWPGTNYDAIEQFAQPRTVLAAEPRLRGRAGNTSLLRQRKRYQSGRRDSVPGRFPASERPAECRSCAIDDWTFGLNTILHATRRMASIRKTAVVPSSGSPVRRRSPVSSSAIRVRPSLHPHQPAGWRLLRTTTRCTISRTSALPIGPPGLSAARRHSGTRSTWAQTGFQLQL